MKIYMDTTFLVCEAHLKKCGNKTTGTDIVTSHYPVLLYHFLNGVEGVNEVFGVLHRRHVVAHLAEALCECRSAELLLVEREVDMIERRILVVDQYRRDNLTNIAYLATACNDDCSRRNNLLAVRILLGKREGIFSRRYINLKCTAEVAQCLHG